MSVYLTVIIKSIPGNAEQMKNLLKTLVIGSKSETACLQYDLHQVMENPDLFIFHEEWKSQEDLDLHDQTAHVKKFVEKSAAIMDGNPIKYITERIA